MRDKLWRMAYDRYHTQETDPEKRKENEERYHALVKMLAAVERQNLLQDIEEKKLLNCDADFESFIDGLEGALMLLAEMAKYPEIKQIIEENMKRKRESSLPRRLPPVWPCGAPCGRRPKRSGNHPHRPKHPP